MHAEAVVYKELVSSSAAATLVGKANTTASLTLLPNTHRYDGILVVAHEGASHRTIVKTTYTHTNTQFHPRQKQRQVLKQSLHMRVLNSHSQYHGDL